MPILRLLKRAPADRVWRRRGLLLLCRAFPGEAPLVAKKNEHSAKVPRTACVTAFQIDQENGDSFSTLLQRCFELTEEGIFRSIIGFL